MSDSASDLLAYGIAAAKAHDTDEARFYLEWVLRSDPDLEQEADAWYWLSQVNADPAEKRQCLESALAASPNYPEARRDLAILVGSLDPKDLYNNPFAPTLPVCPPEMVGDNELRRFQCPRCGARTVYDPRLGEVRCQFCGYRAGQATSQSAGHSTPAPGDEEQDWIAAMYTKKGHEWVLPVKRVMKCQACGAVFAFPPSVVSVACPYCAAATVVVTAVAQGLIQPEGIAAFALDATEAIRRAHDWLANRPLSPSSLADLSTIVPPRPLYVPFWTFDAAAELTWSGHSNEREMAGEYRESTGGTASVLFDDIRIPGSVSAAEPLIAALKFETRSLLPYSPDLLANWPAEIYTVPLSDASVRAHEYARKMAEPRFRTEMAAMLSLLEQWNVDQVEVTLNTYKHVLLPVWKSSYTFQGQTHPLAISGQTGEVRGEVPRRGLKRLLGDLLAED